MKTEVVLKWNGWHKLFLKVKQFNENRSCIEILSLAQEVEYWNKFNENRSCIEIPPLFQETHVQKKFNENRSCIEMKLEEYKATYVTV